MQNLYSGLVVVWSVAVISSGLLRYLHSRIVLQKNKPKNVLMRNILLLIVSLLFILTGSIGVHAALVSYTYDNLSRLTRVDYGSGVFISFTYDEIGNLTNVSANGEPVVVGDIDNDGSITLTDVMLGLQVTSRQGQPAAVTNIGDINGDGKIGMEEVLHALQKVAGER